MELDIFADTDTVVAAWVALVAGSIAAEQELDQYLAAAGRDMGQDFVPTSGMVIDLETYLPAECEKGTFSLTHYFIHANTIQEILSPSTHILSNIPLNPRCRHIKLSNGYFRSSLYELETFSSALNLLSYHC